MKAYWGSEDLTPRILNLGTRWRWVVSFTLQPLYCQGNSPGCPLVWGWIAPRGGKANRNKWITPIILGMSVRTKQLGYKWTDFNKIWYRISSSMQPRPNRFSGSPILLYSGFTGLGVKRSEHEANCSSSGEVISWSCTSIPIWWHT
jgi:hypothetical protein